jgi:sterol desaturase/sphingolipid hydroxylase (fatty acid hydroxylase superfamily)
VRFLALEHSRFAYRADLALYGAAVPLLAALLLAAGPRGLGPQLVAYAVLGLASWTAIEYALHRFVLHGIQPFRRWHAEHHQRPTALICTPTILSASLIATLVFLPAWLVLGGWPAGAVTLGVLTGYLAYTVTHHATHHWRAGGAWLLQRKRWHAQHHRAQHRAGDRPGCYGVTSSFWDHVFGSTGQPARGRVAFQVAVADSARADPG